MKGIHFMPSHAATLADQIGQKAIQTTILRLQRVVTPCDAIWAAFFVHKFPAPLPAKKLVQISLSAVLFPEAMGPLLRSP